MRQNLLVLAIMIASASLCVAQEMLPIQSSGVTTIDVTVKKMKVKVTIHTVRIDRTNPLFPYPKDGWYPDELSVLQSLQIAVDGGEAIQLPGSALPSQWDPNWASIRFEKGDFSLEILGGDASLSTMARVYFDKKRVKRVVGYDPFGENRPVWEGRYLKVKPAEYN